MQSYFWVEGHCAREDGMHCIPPDIDIVDGEPLELNDRLEWIAGWKSLEYKLKITK